MLSILAAIYGLAVRLRNSLYDREILKVIHIRKPVISIGNLSAGGTGKTPLTILLSDLLLEELNISNAIIGRGYKKKKKGLIIVSDGKNILSGPEESGDEMYMMAINTKAPVIACEKKYLAARYADKNLDFDCLLVDDGFQHRKLYRDIDIVIIDNKTLNDNRLLPKGRLREPINNLNRAQIIFYRDMDEGVSLHDAEVNENILNVYIKTIYICLLDTYSQHIEFKYLNNVFCFSGLADNNQFHSMLKSYGVTISKSLSFNDHHDYKPDEINNIIAECKRNGINHCVTSEKDFVKVKKFTNQFEENSINLYYPKLSFEIAKGKDELKEKIRKLFNK